MHNIRRSNIFNNATQARSAHHIGCREIISQKTYHYGDKIVIPENPVKDDDVELESKMIFKQIEEFLSLNNVSRELLVNLVDKIVLSQDKVVKIYLNFFMS